MPNGAASKDAGSSNLDPPSLCLLTFAEVHMIKIKGVYDGSKIVLLEPVSLLPNTPVEVLIPEQEQIYWQRLLELGLIKDIHSQLPSVSKFMPINVAGEPVSQTIIAERR